MIHHSVSPALTLVLLFGVFLISSKHYGSIRCDWDPTDLGPVQRLSERQTCLHMHCLAGEMGEWRSNRTHSWSRSRSVTKPETDASVLTPRLVLFPLGNATCHCFPRMTPSMQLEQRSAERGSSCSLPSSLYLKSG